MGTGGVRVQVADMEGWKGSRLPSQITGNLRGGLLIRFHANKLTANSFGIQ